MRDKSPEGWPVRLIPFRQMYIVFALIVLCLMSVLLCRGVGGRVDGVMMSVIISDG
jgi:hypothetical protein